MIPLSKNKSESKNEPIGNREPEPDNVQNSCDIQVPLIRQITIERFRGILKLVWNPGPGLNIILGGGDVGKTTILDAISLLLSPSDNNVLSDADYWRREVEKGFRIEAVAYLPEKCAINQQAKNAWPWEWNGTEPQLPHIDDEPTLCCIKEPVYRLQVRGTADFDLVFEVIQPDGTLEHLSAAVRRRIGLVRLTGADREDRDLRLVKGSALDRLISDKALRARLGQKLGESDIEDKLKGEAKSKLLSLEEAFLRESLPSGLGLGLTGSQGLSINALIGLTATRDETKLPIANWGAGTRRLAALEIAAVLQGEASITLVDEIERGLEPYRQRVLIAKLKDRASQVFLTTHSPAALSAASDANLWYVDSEGNIGQLPRIIERHISRDPETFLARIAIIAEGATEVGFVRALLQEAIGYNLLQHGIWITDGCGNEQTLQLLEGLVDSGLMFGAFVDDEGTNPTKWATIKKKIGDLLFRWPSGCIEENIIKLVPQDRLEDFIKDTEGDSGDRLRTLADRLGISSKEFSVIRTEAPDLTALIIEAATGYIPENKRDASNGEKKALRRHDEKWFKSVDGGIELATKIFAFGLWPQLRKQLLPFINAVRIAVSLENVAF